MNLPVQPLALLVAALLAQTATPNPTAPNSTAPNPAAPKAAERAPAAATPGTYHSEPLHFDYSFDGSLVRMDSVAKDAMDTAKGESEGVAKKAMDCVSLPLMAADNSGGLRMLVMMRLDVKCLGVPVTISKDQVTLLSKSALVESLSRMGGQPTVGTATAYDLGGHDAATVSGTVKLEKEGTVFYGSATCYSTATDAVCWEFAAQDCRQLAALAAYPVKFEGKEPEPVIPATLLAACPAASK